MCLDCRIYALTVLYLALTVLYLALTVLYLALTVLYLALTVLYLALTVLYLASAPGDPGGSARLERERPRRPSISCHSTPAIERCDNQSQTDPKWFKCVETFSGDTTPCKVIPVILHRVLVTAAAPKHILSFHTCRSTTR